MHHRGRQRMENIRPITATSPLSEDSPTSRLPAAPPTPRPAVALSPDPRTGRAVWPGSRPELCNGCKVTIWYMTIARTIKGTIPLHRSAGANYVEFLLLIAIFLNFKKMVSWDVTARLEAASKPTKKYRGKNYCTTSSIYLLVDFCWCICFKVFIGDNKKISGVSGTIL